MNKALLRSFMVKNNDTQATLANALGISLSNLNAKINGKTASFRQNEIAAIIDRYRLNSAETEAIFFSEELS